MPNRTALFAQKLLLIWQLPVEFMHEALGLKVYCTILKLIVQDGHVCINNYRQV